MAHPAGERTAHAPARKAQALSDRDDERAAVEEPPLDPDARARAYRQARLRRYARRERDRAQRYAGLRFWAVLAVLLAASVFVTLTAWREIEQLFGL